MEKTPTDLNVKISLKKNSVKNNNTKIAENTPNSAVEAINKALPDEKCRLKNCDLCCKRGSLVQYGVKKHGWKQRLILAFLTVQKCTGRTWVSLSRDIYPFFDAHWDTLWPTIKKENYFNWRKKLQDSLSHNKDIFESGTIQFSGKKGFWRLNETTRMEQGLSEDSEDEVSSPIGSDSSSPAVTHNKEVPQIPKSEVALLLGALLNSSPSSTSTKPSLNLTYSCEFPKQAQKRPVSDELETPQSKKLCLSQETISLPNPNTLNFSFSPVDTALSKDFANFLVRQGIQTCKS